MGRIINRRNAVLGWAVWVFARRRAKRKAQEVVPFADAEPKRSRLVRIGVGVLTAIGVVALWRKLRGRNGGDVEPAPVEVPPPDTPPTPITEIRDDDVPPAA
jgi:hypothetical protein